MTHLVLVRHGPTVWNGEGRLQGRTDMPLSDEGREIVATWRVPSTFDGFDLVVSPLRRCTETAALLARTMTDPPTPRCDPRLVEMSWGQWEGRTLSELREAYGDGLEVNEGRGLDFRPHGGESPHDVQERVRPVLEEIGRTKQPTLAVVHRGVMRAVYALATGWDMRSKTASPAASQNAARLCVAVRYRSGRRPAPAALRFAAFVGGYNVTAAGKRRILFYVQHLLGIGHIMRAATLTRALQAAGFEVDVRFRRHIRPGLRFGRRPLRSIAANPRH